MSMQESAGYLECSFRIMEPGLPKLLMSTRCVSKRGRVGSARQSARAGHLFCTQWIPVTAERQRAGLKIRLESMCR